MVSWLDTPQRYGRISRSFHSLMAALFIWQFAETLLFVSIGDTALTKLVGRSHLNLGFTLFVLVLLRGIWALVNLKRRPPHPGSRGRAAVAGHALIYAVMVIQPAIALLRQYGSGKDFSPYGIPLMSERPYKIDWMMAPADALHYWLGFAFLLMLISHVTMIFVHQRVLHEGVLSRMR